MSSASSVEDLEEVLEGAVIESLESGINGLHVNLVDGRVLVFQDAQLVAVYRPLRTLQ